MENGEQQVLQMKQRKSSLSVGVDQRASYQGIHRQHALHMSLPRRSEWLEMISIQSHKCDKLRVTYLASIRCGLNLQFGGSMLSGLELRAAASSSVHACAGQDGHLKLSSTSNLRTRYTQ